MGLSETGEVIFFSSTIFSKAVKEASESATKLVQPGDPPQLWRNGYSANGFRDPVRLPKSIEKAS
jgi:hypothetical protein